MTLTPEHEMRAEYLTQGVEHALDEGLEIATRNEFIKQLVTEFAALESEAERRGMERAVKIAKQVLREHKGDIPCLHAKPCELFIDDAIRTAETEDP